MPKSSEKRCRDSSRTRYVKKLEVYKPISEVRDHILNSKYGFKKAVAQARHEFTNYDSILAAASLIHHDGDLVVIRGCMHDQFKNMLGFSNKDFDKRG